MRGVGQGERGEGGREGGGFGRGGGRGEGGERGRGEGREQESEAAGVVCPCDFHRSAARCSDGE